MVYELVSARYDVGTVFIRTSKSRGIEYLQLAHNERDADGKVKPRILHNLGRKDKLDQEALLRLVNSISRYLDADDAAKVPQDAGLEAPFEFLGAKQLGGTHLLDGLWQRLGIGKVLGRLLAGRDYQVPIERLLFALVANRALEPRSKLAAESWVSDVAHIDGLAAVEVQQLYRAMDFLLEAHDDIQREVFWNVKNLFNLEVDLIFVDTTRCCLECQPAV